MFSVDVTKGFRSAAASIKLTVVEGNPPAVWVNVAHIKMNSNDRLKLQGYYKTNTEPAKVEWSSSQEQGVSNGDDEDNLNSLGILLLRNTLLGRELPSESLVKQRTLKFLHFFHKQITNDQVRVRGGPP